MVNVDMLTAGIVVALLAFFFFIYLMLRRALVDFRKGMNQGRR